MKINDVSTADGVAAALSAQGNASGDAGNLIYISVDSLTEATTDVNTPTAINSTIAPFDKSLLFGFNTGVSANKVVRIDQGLDTNEIPYSQPIDSSLKENQYIIEIDNRLGSIIDVKTNQKAAISYIDDDNIASYYLSLANDVNFVKDLSALANGGGAAGSTTGQVILGPRGSALVFRIGAAIDLQQSTYLFELLGDTQSYTSADGNTSTYYYIDAVVRITGAQTGASIDLPIRFLKYKSTP